MALCGYLARRLVKPRYVHAGLRRRLGSSLSSPMRRVCSVMRWARACFARLPFLAYASTLSRVSSLCAEFQPPTSSDATRLVVALKYVLKFSKAHADFMCSIMNGYLPCSPRRVEDFAPALADIHRSHADVGAHAALAVGRSGDLANTRFPAMVLSRCAFGLSAPQTWFRRHVVCGITKKSKSFSGGDALGLSSIRSA